MPIDVGFPLFLQRFMDDYMPSCAQAGLDAINGGELDQLHVVHDGILGDRNHSPRSLHAENRAIDVHSFIIKKYDGTEKEYIFGNTANRKFFQAFRECWGEAVHVNNGCPYYNGERSLTGSIGWENKDHQHHMHTSVPYCLSGTYGSGFYRR